VLMNNIAGGFSDAALAAASISKKTTGFLGGAIMGFGMGYQPLAGFCWGAKRFKRVRDSFKVYSAIGWAAAIVMGVVMAVFAKNLVLIFTNASETEVVRLGTIMIVSQCITLIPHVWGVVVNGLCQAAGKPLYSLLVGLARNFICLVPSIVILSAVLGVNGLAVSNAAGDALSLLICVPIAVSLMKQCKREEEKSKEQAQESVSAEPQPPQTASV